MSMGRGGEACCEGVVVMLEMVSLPTFCAMEEVYHHSAEMVVFALSRVTAV